MIAPAAVSGDILLNLASGSTNSKIAGNSLSISNNTVIENAYAGDGNDLLIGNSADNKIDGGRGNDTLFGGAGNDLLIGDRGADTFAFDGLGQGIDTLDFNPLDDNILLLGSVFSNALGSGILNANQFVTGSFSQDLDDRVIYNSVTGGLFFDSDGFGGQGQVQFAQLNPNLTLANTNFFIEAPVTPPVEPVTPPVEPVTPPVEPVTPPVEPVTPPVEPVTPPATSQVYFSLHNSQSLGGISFADEDIIGFDGTSFTKYFDGSNVDLSGLEIDGFDIISDTEILMSFTASTNISGVGTVDDSDIVLFRASQLGNNTAGTFEMFFDGSDVGLSTSNEDVDAFTLLQDGRLIISTTGSERVSGASGRDEDLLAFTPTSLGVNTSGSWDKYFDGSDVGLSSEDIVGVSVDETNGDLYFSTIGDLSAQGVTGKDEDIFKFTPTSLGTNTQGSIASSLYFDGSNYGLDANDIRALDLQVGNLPTIV